MTFDFVFLFFFNICVTLCFSNVIVFLVNTLSASYSLNRIAQTEYRKGKSEEGEGRGAKRKKGEGRGRKDDRGEGYEVEEGGDDCAE